MINYEAVTPVVEEAARKVASRFPSHHDISDIKQEMWVAVMERRESIADMMSKSEGSTKLLENLLIKIGNSYLKGEDAAVYGYDEEDVFNYSVELIRNILEVVFVHENWQSLASAIGDGMPRQKSDPATSGNNLASYADVSRVVEELPEDQYNVLVWRYKYHRTFQQIGDDAGITRQGAQDRHRAALSAIQQALGKRDLSEFRRGYSGRQPNRSSESMSIQIDRDYNG